jgi:hypothetical protein
MVGRNALRCCLVVVALLGARSATAGPISATAGPINFTGNVANDFNPATNPGVEIITDSIHQNDPSHLAQPSWMTAAGLVSGWNIKNVALDYNAATDTMYVGVRTYGVAGNVDGNGTPGTPDPRLTAAGGTDPANFGGDKALAVAFAPLTGTFNPSKPPTPVIVAGISGDKATQTGPGLDGFNVTKYAGGTTPGTVNLLTGFGKTLTAGLGNLAFDPSSAHPGFEFTITNFSKILGANPAKGLVVLTQDGSVNSVVTGKDQLVGTYPTNEAQTIPEPTTFLVWAGLAAGAMAWRDRRSRRTFA